MAKLTYVCMKIPLFRKIVATPKLETRSKKNRYLWKTTNKMLGTEKTDTGKWVAKNEWVKGCKTGIT